MGKWEDDKRHTQKMNISSSIYHEILGVGLRIERKGWEKWHKEKKLKLSERREEGKREKFRNFCVKFWMCFCCYLMFNALSLPDSTYDAEVVSVCYIDDVEEEV